MHRVTLASVAFVALACGGLATASEPAQYRASYEVRHQGRHAANAEFGVVAGDDGRYTFSSVTEARGLLKIVAPGPATETSRFRLAGGYPVPIEFAYDDGSRKGEDNYTIAFDAAAGAVRIERAAGRAQQLPYDAGLLDRGSLQVAVMLDLAQCRQPGPYRYVDEDGVRLYRYERLDDRQAETPSGRHDTVRFAQQREGSSRTTILWLAPELRYLPVIVEQVDEGETETVFSLREAEVEPAETMTCSGLR